MELVLLNAKNAEIRPSRAIISHTSNAMAQRVLGNAERLSIELPNSIAELKNWLIDQENHLARESARQGFGFLVLKKELGEGEFAKWLIAHDFKEQRVYEHISIAKMLLAAPANIQPLLMGLGKVKLIELARLPNETITQAAECGVLDELSRLSVRELKDQVRRLKSNNQKMALDLKAAHQLSENLKAQKARDPALGVTDAVASDFIGSVALAEDWLERGLNELCQLQTVIRNDFIWTQDSSSPQTWDSVACHLYTVTARIYGQLRTLLDQLTLELPESARGGLALIESRLTDQRLTDIVNARQQQARQADQDRLLHHAAKGTGGARKRGRPKKQV
jgi:hypothetical protein